MPDDPALGTVLVTGGASGLGAAVVAAVAREGGKPVVLDRQAPADGVAWEEVDLTRGQFAPHETVQPPRVVVRPPGLPRYNGGQYLRLRAAVHTALGLPV